MSVTSRSTTAGSRPITGSSRHMGSCKSVGYTTTGSGAERSKFDMWNYVKRPATGNPYELTARYRLSHAPVRRVKSGVVSRRRCTNSTTGSESNESNRTLASALGSVDFDRDYPDDFDYDAADDDLDQSRKSVSGSHSQMIYVRMCRRLKVTPNSHVMRNLTRDRLVLTHHLLGPDGVKALCVALIENSSVTSLDMKDNGLGEMGAKHVSDMLTENSFISELNLADNNLRSAGIQCVVDVIKELNNVLKLDLSGNLLQEYDGDTIRDLIEETKNLKELRCAHNSFRETGGMAIADAIGWNDNLEVLDLSWNHLRRQGASAIAASLAINSGLRELNVSWNGFYLEGCRELGRSLEKNRSLMVLDLSSNRINRECLHQLVKGLRHNSALRVLKLADNPITSAGAIFLLRQLLEMKDSGIERLDLGDQSVEPEFLVVLQQLQEDRDVSVRFGAVLGQDLESRDEEMELMDENPVVVLMEFGKMLNLRLVDLFTMMDKDNSKTLTRFEIKNGLLEANIPLSEKALDQLVEKLDADGDGEIDYGELIAGQQRHRRKITRTILMSREQRVDMEETEVGRVRAKLKKLMDNHNHSKLKPKHEISLLQPKASAPGVPVAPVVPGVPVEASQKPPAPTAEGSNPAMPTLKLSRGALLKGLV